MMAAGSGRAKRRRIHAVARQVLRHPWLAQQQIDAASSGCRRRALDAIAALGRQPEEAGLRVAAPSRSPGSPSATKERSPAQVAAGGGCAASSPPRCGRSRWRCPAPRAARRAADRVGIGRRAEQPAGIGLEVPALRRRRRTAASARVHAWRAASKVKARAPLAAPGRCGATPARRRPHRPRRRRR